MNFYEKKKLAHAKCIKFLSKLCQLIVDFVNQ